MSSTLDLGSRPPRKGAQVLAELRNSLDDLIFEEEEELREKAFLEKEIKRQRSRLQVLEERLPQRREAVEALDRVLVEMEAAYRKIHDSHQAMLRAQRRKVGY
eukprot:TRINITY_DN21266_c0_g1_i1.p2 TRINITY_DN21266_c0_g1~~TRINITY_DN21266_c0_g1_i1.p2  ORF type:complete len:103 (-),score=51.27 TRINITY_DN21266_c0_g1_i1:176-484(-)